MSRILVLIDLQNDDGLYEPCILDEAMQAAHNCASLLHAARAAGMPVLHIRHEASHAELLAGADEFIPGTHGAKIHDLVAPVGTEKVVTKNRPNGFVGTDLEEYLRVNRFTTLVVAGLMSHMCVDATVRAAVDKGFTVELVHDACAASPRTYMDRVIPAADAHACFMSALGQSYATLHTTAEVVNQLSR